MLNNNITFFRNFLLSFLMCLMVYSYQVNAQDNLIKKPVTLKEKDSFLQDVIDTISSQIQNIFFIYDDILVNDKKISYSCNNKPVDEVISTIAKQANLSFECIQNNTFVFYRNNINIKSDAFYKDNRNNNGILWQRDAVSPPERIFTSSPDYPALAKRNNIEGSVKLSFLINRSGRVEKVRLLKSSGHEILDRAAIDYSKKIIFEPAKKGDTAISTWYSMDFDYELFKQGFSPNIYVNEILDYYSKIENNAHIRHKNLLSKVLDIHIKYINEFSIQKVKINYYIDKIISPEIRTEWEEFWDFQDLSFLVFHDFIQRSPFSELDKKAKEYLVKFLAEVIESDESVLLGKQNLFQKKVYTLLKNDYPEIVKEIFREEVTLN